MNLKPGVKFDGVKAPILKALAVVEEIMGKYGAVTVTSLLDGKHSAKSLHYVGLACDLRTRHMAPGEIEACAQDLRLALGADYDVVVETDHIHCEVSDVWLAHTGDPRKG